MFSLWMQFVATVPEGGGANGAGFDFFRHRCRSWWSKWPTAPVSQQHCGPMLPSIAIEVADLNMETRILNWFSSTVAPAFTPGSSCISLEAFWRERGPARLPSAPTCKRLLSECWASNQWAIGGADGRHRTKLTGPASVKFKNLRNKKKTSMLIKLGLPWCGLLKDVAEF